MKINFKSSLPILIRIMLGWFFLWAFLDKTFGLGFSTPRSKSWLNGNSPTLGFLKFGVNGFFKEFFTSLAGNPIVDWLFMLGLLAVGLSLIFGLFLKLGSYAGILMMFLIWLSLIPLENNPFVDEHIIYILVLGFISYGGEFRKFSLDSLWKSKLIS